MSEEIEKLIDKIKSGITLTNVRIGLFDIQGNILYSSLGERASAIASRLTKGAFEAWDIGDYQVKHMEKGCLLVSRVTEKLALAIDAYEREGLVIVAMGALMKRFANEFKKIDSLLPGKPVVVEEKITAEITEPPKPVEEPSPKVQEVAPPEPKVEAKPEEKEFEFINITPDLVLMVSEAKANKIEMDPIMLGLIRVIDGVRPVEDVVKLAGYEFRQVLPKLIYLIQQGVLKVVSHPEADDIRYQYVYELVPPYTVDNVAEKACAGRSDEVVTIMTNLDRGYTISELSMGLKKVDMEKSPKEVYEILEYYRGINVVRIKQVGPEEPKPEWKENPDYQLIYDYVPGLSFDEVVKKLLIGDRKTLVLLRNLHLKHTVLEYTMGLRGMGIDTTPDEVLKALKELEKRGIVRRI
ncbi:MAG: hypothetical protein ACTSYQ_02435 [Candidatus Odinarchaeia archaeon]